MDSNQPVDPAQERLYTPAPGETQLTLRAILAGCSVGAISGVMNIYLGLKIGWTVGGSLLTAILAFAFFTVIKPRRKYSVLETNISQTTGSAAGYMASAGGLVAPIPAMFMLGYEIPLYALFLWGLATAYLGVFFAVPLRRQYVLVEKLRFPTGTATAHTIMSMFATAGEAVAKARVLLWTGVAAAAFSLAAYFVPYIEHPPLNELGGVFATMGAWTFGLYFGPTLFGAGFLIGNRVATSLFVGAIVGWGILGPLATHYGWVSGAPTDVASGGRGWILWPGAAIMVGDALMSLGLSYKTILRTFMRAPAVAGSGDDDDDPVGRAEPIPNSWWIGGLALGSALTCTIALLVFGIPVWMSLIAIAMSSVLASIATRSTGETDINPVGGMGKVTQMVFGGLAPGSTSTNLMAAAITGAGASQAGDMMQDLKTGYLLGASPRKQLVAQLCGVAMGVVVTVPIFLLFDRAYDIGNGPQLPAPAAVAWRAVAEVMAQGFDKLPTHAEWAMLGGLLFGAALPVLRKIAPRLAPYTPSGLAFGIAFIVHAYFSICMFMGALVLMAWKGKNRDSAERFTFAVACGLIAGEGLMGVVKAVLTLLGVPPLV